ncbi:MAG: oligosaccharide flippase family protein [Proteobacteria bacterium]|nr:oligosaccharide flippase family protein [Pseudomonadota bacterium]
MSFKNNKRIAKNTLMLYFRQIITLLVSLYTVRIVLNVLGVEDYGIYNVIGGVVALLSFLNGSMASATQRFFSFALGEKNPEKLKKIFSSNCLIYGVIALVALVLLETFGLWFVNEFLQVPAERYLSARWTFHFSVFAFVSTIISTPFIAIIIAHEDMQFYAYMSIVESTLKLGIAFLLVCLPWDKLELYGLLFFAVSFINTLLYVSICVKKYAECQFRAFHWDKKLLREILDFTGWTLFGQLSTVFRKQAITILLNQMFNPATVAARAIATNVTSRITMFSTSFNVGLYPPIIKSYANGENKEMFSLIFNGSKITFSLMWIFALPLFIEMETILQIWLNKPPADAVLFTRLALVEVLLFSLSLPIATAARAPGKMKSYELVLGSVQIAIFVAAWIVLKLGSAAYSVYIVAIIANLVMFVFRLVIVRSLIGIPLRKFLYQVLFPVSLISLISGAASIAVSSLLPKGLFFTLMIILTSITFTSITIYYIALNKTSRNKVNEVVAHQIRKRLIGRFA